MSRWTAEALAGIERLRREGRVIEHSRAPAASPIAETLSEKDFMAAVITLARRAGWLVYHTYDSRRSEAGWPDLFMVRGNRAIAAELKSADGRLTAEQANWLDALRAAGIETYTWRPVDWADVEVTLA